MAAVHYAPAAMHYLRGIDALLSAVSVHFFSGIFKSPGCCSPVDAGHFSTPLNYKEPFSIVYFMKIPGELGQLSNNEEMMSISLNRFSKRVEKLVFSVYLDFLPSSVETFMRDEDGRASALRMKPDVVEIDQVDEIDERFRNYISKVRTACKISISVNHPEKETYIIYYRK